MQRFKKKFQKTRRVFKKELYVAMSDNLALTMLIVETYTAWQHRHHIMKIWELLGFSHREDYKDYCNKLLGKHLTGREDIWRSFYFAGYESLYNYRTKIPEKLAMGDALSVAYTVLKRKESVKN